MEDVQTRIQNAVGKMISTLDKEVLRKMQVSYGSWLLWEAVAVGMPNTFWGGMPTGRNADSYNPISGGMPKTGVNRNEIMLYET